MPLVAMVIFLRNDKDGTDVPFGHIIRVAMIDLYHCSLCHHHEAIPAYKGGEKASASLVTLTAEQKEKINKANSSSRMAQLPVLKESPMT
jgi:hypothetical protein